jgi:hypothetical protein
MSSTPSDFVHRDWITTVFETPDTPLRTFRITLSYSMFAQYLDERLFGDHSVVSRRKNHLPIATSNANWFNFATWGTYTLGPNIRNDGAPQRLNSLPSSVRRRFAPMVVQSRDGGGQLVGQALAWGQELIFLSAASALVRFRELTVAQMEAMDQFITPRADQDNVLNQLNVDGERWIDPGHLKLVDEAFDCYRLVLLRMDRIRARFPADSTRQYDTYKSDLVIPKLLLLATALLTAAEQAAVNTALAVVIDSIPVRMLQEVDRQVAKFVQRRRGIPSQVAAVKLLTQLRTTQTPLSDAWARFMTDQLLVIVLPTEMLRLGRDVPLRDPVGPMFPAALRNLQVPTTPLAGDPPWTDEDKVKAKLGRLRNFVASFDRSNSGAGSAARDWRRFDDRLNWALSLFRSRQQDLTLFWPPYSVEDTERIWDGKLPRATGDAGQGGVSPPLNPDAIRQFLRTTP